jgi:DNA invertase Pin-like site-specific DNA recombinase
MKKLKRAACYVRVSTGLQDTKAQETELKQYAQSRGWSVIKVYADKASGVKESRPALDELMADCRKRKVDVVLVWKFDRFARSVTHLLKALEAFEASGIEFVSLSEQIDTTSPAGKMVFTVLAAVGCLERSMIVERVKAGLAQARRDGKVLGRPAIKRLSGDEIAKIRVARAKGVTLRALASRFKSSLWSIHQASLGGKS